MSLTVEDLWQIIHQERGLRTEWFGEATPFDMIAESMTALANTLGGNILVGITGNTGNLIGVRNVSDMVDQLVRAALSLEPHLIIPLPTVVRVSGKSVVVVQIPAGMPNVYSYNGRYLHRQSTDNLPLKPVDLRRLILERGEISFETEIASGTVLSDVDWDKARAYAAMLSGVSDQEIEQVLLRRGCITRQDSALKPTNAGILLFGKEPQRFIRGADIIAARFAGDTMTDTFSKQDLSGTLPEQIRRAEMFLVDHLRKGVQIGQAMARQESFEYPMEAARELVVNAVAHRDYRISGDSIRLFVFSNRMEVSSPGGLPGPVTIDNIKDERFSRNPVIVQVLSDMGFIERLGYGVDRVIDLMRQQELQEPEFQETAGGFRVVLRNHNVPAPAANATKPQPVLQFNGIYHGIEINPRQESALIHLHRDGSSRRITNSELQTLCPDVHPETIRRDLADLVTKNVLRKLGQKRGSYYVLNEEFAS